MAFPRLVRLCASIQPLFAVMLLVTGTVVSSEGVTGEGHGYSRDSVIETQPTPLPLGRSKSGPVSVNPDVMLNDRKKSLSDNEVFDGSTKSQLDLLLLELREVKTEIREARQEHGRLASGVAEISGQVRVISDRKDQIKKKIRKLTKTLSKKDHHRKVKGSFRSLQQDHERILQAMAKAKLLNRVSNRRNNRTNHHNHTGAGQHGRGHGGEEGQVNPTNATLSEVARKNNEPKNHEMNEDSEESEEEVAPEDNLPVVLPIEIEKKTHHEANSGQEQTPHVFGRELEEGFTPVPTPSPTTTTSSTTTSTTTTTVAAPTTTPTTTTTTTPAPTSPPLPVNCYEILQYGNWTSGVYTIQPGTVDPIKVWCDQRTDGGGWTLMVARRPQDSQEDFSRPWADYKKGFGDPSQEHWIGLEILHQMTKNLRHELRVNITDWAGNEYEAQWKEFAVSSEDRGYKLTVGRYANSVSTAGDALKWHNSMKFSTVDRDNDVLMGGSCARLNQGGWWYRGYRGCYQAHPTGIFQMLTQTPAAEATDTEDGTTLTPTTAKPSRTIENGPFIHWANWRGTDLVPKTIFFMIRPRRS